MRTCLLFLFLLFAFPAAAQAQTKGIFLTKEEIAALPISGKGWDGMKARADKSVTIPDLSNQEEDENVNTLARALVFARIGGAGYRDKVISVLRKVPETENGGRTLALGRKLAAYVIAADLVGFNDSGWNAWLKAVRDEVLDGSTLRKKSETKMNNWGSSTIDSRIAVAAFLYDGSDAAKAELNRCVQVFRFMLGDRAAGFIPASSAFGCLDWQPDPSRPYVVCPKGALKDGKDMSGALPEELRRWSGGECGGFRWPPPCENYTWSAIEGLFTAAWLLAHNGSPDVFEWSDRALFRVIDWNYRVASCVATGNDTWIPHEANAVYGTAFAAPSPSTPGKICGFADWWAKAVLAPPPPPPADFVVSLEYHYDTAGIRWVCHRINDGDTQAGAGTTPNAAGIDWHTKNPLP